jgi:hypothetical protein|tara:strand:- start:74 stop:280 length:207 start_codon:yes stop_codon:yes gene_type:complete
MRNTPCKFDKVIYRKNLLFLISSKNSENWLLGKLVFKENYIFIIQRRANNINLLCFMKFGESFGEASK